jgi:hypothetical protein
MAANQSLNADNAAWEEMMQDMDRALNALDMIYSRCLRAVAVAEETRDLSDLKRLLNQSIPATEEDRRLAFAISFLARIKRGALIEYLFKVRRPCLLMLLDGRGVATALKCENKLEIWIDEEDNYHAEWMAAETIAAQQQRRADRPARAAQVGNRRGGSRDYGIAANGSRANGAAPRASAGRANGHAGARIGPARSASTGKPIMDMSQCRQVLASVASEVENDIAAEAIASQPADAAPLSATSYLSVAQKAKAPATGTKASMTTVASPSPNVVAAMAAATAALALVNAVKTSSDAVAKPSESDQIEPAAEPTAESTEDGVPATEDNAQATEDNAPATEDNAPATEDNAPATEDNAPATEDNTPATEDNTPATEDNAPATETDKSTNGSTPTTAKVDWAAVSGRADNVEAETKSWADMTDEDDEAAIPAPVTVRASPVSRPLLTKPVGKLSAELTAQLSAAESAADSEEPTAAKKPTTTAAAKKPAAAATKSATATKFATATAAKPATATKTTTATKATTAKPATATTAKPATATKATAAAKKVASK